MKTSTWSSLLVGTMLATALGVAARAEDAGETDRLITGTAVAGLRSDVARTPLEGDLTTGSIAAVAAPETRGPTTLATHSESGLAPLPRAAETLARHAPSEEATPLAPAVAPAAPPPDLDAAAAPAPTTPRPEIAAAPATVAEPAAAPVAASAHPPAPASAATDAAISAALAEQRVSESLQKSLEALQLRAGPSEERSERAALLAFYRDRDWRPLFTRGDAASPTGRAVLDRLAHAAEDGLEPRDYLLPTSRATGPDARAETEIALAGLALRYVRHLAVGRFDPGRLSDLVTPTLERPDAAAVLRGIAAAPDVGAVLAAWAPRHEGYRRLRAELARLRAESPETPIVRLPDGPLLKPGQKDARVAALRERLGVSAVASDADLFDPALAEAVKSFQRERGLAATGTLGRSTVSALNEEANGSADRIADVVVNMERWRWLPRELGELHVFVNIPDFFLDVMKDGRSIHHARVVTGRPENQTPIFSDTMRFVVVNPYWNVPVSIVEKEMLGKAQASAGEALTRGNYEVEVANQRVDPTTVDWSQVSARQVTIRQRPGDGNALGNIKFLFPNRHSVYIHDTSSRSFFAQSYRALSHGCVRVHEPFSFADAVLSEEPGGLGGAQLKKMIGGGEKQINLKRLVPVHIAYFTEWVDDAGQVQTRRDIYGHDAKMKRLLGL